MGALLKKHGFEYHCVSFLATATETLEDILLSNRLPEEWLKLYIEESMCTMILLSATPKRWVRPFRWFKESPYDPEREPRAAEVVQRARDFGILGWFPDPGRFNCGEDGSIWFGGRTLDLRSTIASPAPDGDLCV